MTLMCKEGHVHMCMLSCFSRVQLLVTLWIVALQATLSVEFSRQEYWSLLPFPYPGDLPIPGTEAASPVVSALQADSLPLSLQGSPKKDTAWGSFVETWQLKASKEEKGKNLYPGVFVPECLGAWLMDLQKWGTQEDTCVGGGEGNESIFEQPVFELLAG